MTYGSDFERFIFSSRASEDFGSTNGADFGSTNDMAIILLKSSIISQNSIWYCVPIQTQFIEIAHWDVFIGPESDHWLPLSLTHC